MSDYNTPGLLEEARLARAEATRGRRLSEQQTDNEVRIELLRFADEMEAKAAVLDISSVVSGVHGPSDRGP